METSDDEVVGTYVVPEEDRADAPPHSQGFDRAFERALEEAARRWPPDEYPRVSVRFEVAVRVWNPADVGEYRVILTR